MAEWLEHSLSTTGDPEYAIWSSRMGFVVDESGVADRFLSGSSCFPCQKYSVVHLKVYGILIGRTKHV